jgi:ribosome-binding ATPase YchF (GTP1/OBG family)
MADKVTKFRRSATAKGQKVQKKEGERKLSSFGEDLSAVMAQDMEEWAKQNTVEQTAQDEIEHIQMGVSSSSQPPVTAMNSGPNEVATKRHRVGAGYVERQRYVVWMM